MVNILALALVLVLAQATRAEPGVDITGVWTANFMGSDVTCQVEQRGQYMYAVAKVTSVTGEVNTYHLAGLVLGHLVRAIHGSGNYFDGQVLGPDQAQGSFHFKDGMSIGISAVRAQAGVVPPGLDWPPGLGPADWKPAGAKP